MSRLIAIVVLCLTAGGALAKPSDTLPPDQPVGLLCRQAIAAAAQVYGIPASLMAAVGRVESGRRDPATGAWHPWPWTVDAEGQGTFYDSKAAAIIAVRSLQARGVQSIDVGCMQVNLMHHPHAFASLEQAFDPALNAEYAARFLVELRSQVGSWPQATALYHSGTPTLGREYERKVMGAWSDEAALTGDLAPVTIARSWGSPFGSSQFVPRVMRKGAMAITPPAIAAQAPVQGRGLAAYRAAPVMPGWRRPTG